MNESAYIALLEDARARLETGEPMDLEVYRNQVGDDRWPVFCELLEFDQAFGSAIEPPAVEGLPRTFGDYTLLRELGRGGVGVVYEAHHGQLDRRVAIKTLRSDFVVTPELRRRYAREARTCAQVRHPSLIEIYEAGEVDGVLFYAMPLLGGGTLADAVKEERAPEPDELCRRMADVADALSAMHAESLVHRDVKPANIVIEQDGRFVLADFGLTRRTDLPALTQTGQSIGTPQYMSPEQLAGKTSDIDARTDIYALGVSLYEALTGDRPFDGTSFQEVYHRVLTERPSSVHDVAPAVPRPLSRVVMKCLERHPQDRYANARELASDLRAAAAGETVTARTVSWTTHLRRRVRIPYLAAAALVLAGIGLGIGLFGGEDRRPPAGIHIQMEPGEKLDPKSLAELLEIARKNGVSLTISPLLSPAERATGDIQPVQLLFPRGAVRAGDIAEVRVDVSEAFEGPGMLVFHKDGDTLAEVPFAASDYRNTLALPDAVLAAAIPGATITWAYEPKHGRAVRASFRVVEPDLDVALARIGNLESREGPSTGVGPMLRALVFLENGLGVAAYRALESVRGEALEDHSLPAVELRAKALQVAFGEDAHALRGSDVWHRLGLRLEDLGAK